MISMTVSDEKLPEIFPRPESDELVAVAEDKAWRWYGSTLPRRVDSYEFIDFAARSWEFARQIAPKAVLKIMKSAPSAMTDGETIWLPGNYFSEKFYKERADISEAAAAAVMCVNGSQIHEALHCALSTCNLPVWCEDHPKAMEYHKNHVGFTALLNLVEDIFIEAWGDSYHAFSTVFVEGKNNILLGQLPAWEYFNALYQPTATQDDLLQALALLKNKVHRDDKRFSPWSALHAKMLEAANHNLTKQQRLVIAIEAWELLVSADKADGSEPLPMGGAGAAAPDRSSPTMGGAMSPEEMEAFLEALDEAISELEEEAAAGGETPGKEAGAGSPGAGAKSAAGPGRVITIDASTLGSAGMAKLDKLLKLKTGRTDVTGDGDSGLESSIHIIVEEMKFERGEGMVNITKIPKVDVRAIDGGREPAKSDRAFIKLGNLLRYLRQEKHAPGQPRLIGSRLVKSRLPRIVTDGKVMAIHDSTHITKGKPEVIMLGDLSGSMESGDLVLRVADAMYGSYESLVGCQVPVAVYGHTSYSRGGHVPLVYAVSAYNMPLIGKQLVTTKNPALAFGRMKTVNHSQNFDGIAIDEVAKRFTKRPGTKVLIVFSDGEPYGGADYGGHKAFDHTAQVIKKLNRAGIVVLSLSLTAEVMENNTKLYGKGNLPAYGRLLEKTLQHVVQVIATGQPLT